MNKAELISHISELTGQAKTEVGTKTVKKAVAKKPVAKGKAKKR